MRLAKALFIALFGFVIYHLNPPCDVPLKAWQLFAVFASTILGIILRPIGMGGIALIGLATAVTLNLLSIQTEALTGFASPTIWLVVSVFCVARGIIKTHLAERIAYCFIFHAGRRTLSLAYALTLTEVIFAPFIPSSTARAGGVMMPVVKSICESFGSYATDDSRKKIGSYLVQVCFHNNIISSALFLTGMVSNPLCQSFAKAQGIQFTWLNWASLSIVPGIISLTLIPLVLYVIFPPQQKVSPNAHILAEEKLKELGPIKTSEMTMVCIFLVMLTLWIIGDYIGVKATSTAILGLSLTLASGIITADDILKEKDAWHTMLWLAVLITLSDFLGKLGFVHAVTHKLSLIFQPIPYPLSFYMITAVYFLIGYCFAGNSAHVSALYASFLSILIAIGAPPLASSLVLAFLSSLYSSMTHYGSSAGGIFMATNYVAIKDWFRLGLIIGVLNFVIWVGLGSIWWRIIGFF